MESNKSHQVPLAPRAGFVAAVPDKDDPRGDPCSCGYWFPRGSDSCLVGRCWRDTEPNKIHDRMLRALTIPGLTNREQIMLAAIAYHDGSGSAFPGLDRLGELAGVKRRQAINIMEKLRRKGRLSWERRDGNRRDVNVYRIAYGDACQCAIQECTSKPVARCAISGSSKCTAGLHPNVEPEAASRRGHEGKVPPDLCEPPGRCRAGAFVPPGGECRRCGWRRPG